MISDSPELNTAVEFLVAKDLPRHGVSAYFTLVDVHGFGGGMDGDDAWRKTVREFGGKIRWDWFAWCEGDRREKAIRRRRYGSHHC
jgi:hypothetical protein